MSGLTASQPRFNPFPGLRPFEPDEDHLFFGRETEIDELLRRLRTTRFLSVVGTSGSGKSSLVRSGSDPVAPRRLHGAGRLELARGDHAARRGSHRAPGRGARRVPTSSANGSAELADHQRACCSRRRCAQRSGLVERRPPGADPARRQPARPRRSVRGAVPLPAQPPRSTTPATRRSPSSSFCSKPPQQQDLPIYVVLTMRSDFIGDCMEYPGLPEAVNDGHYLVPRMTRDELRSADHRPGRRRRRRRSRRAWCCGC